MKKNFNNKSFTLIEIIVILIIVGVLATLSLTQYFKWIDRSRVTEAIITLKNFADQMDGCIAKSSDVAGCFSSLEPTIQSPNYIYGGAGYQLIAYWNEAANSRPTESIALPACNGSSLIAGADHYGWVSLCIDSITSQRILRSGGIFQGLY